MSSLLSAALYILKPWPLVVRLTLKTGKEMELHETSIVPVNRCNRGSGTHAPKCRNSGPTGSYLLGPKWALVGPLGGFFIG